jgi:cytochrome c-type biogenesis protein CcmH
MRNWPATCACSCASGWSGDTRRGGDDFVVSRYGEFVLLSRAFSIQTLLLWGAPLLLLLAGIAVMVINARGRASAVTASGQGLSDAEKAELAKVLQDRDRQG